MQCTSSGFSRATLAEARYDAGFFRPRPADIDVTPTTPHYEVASRPWSEGGSAWHVSKT